MEIAHGTVFNMLLEIGSYFDVKKYSYDIALAEVIISECYLLEPILTNHTGTLKAIFNVST